MIEQASFADILPLCDLIEAMHAESGFSAQKLSHERTFNAVASWLDDPMCCVFVDRRDGELVGVMAGRVCAPWFSAELSGFDLIFYVKPSHRGGIGAYKLLRYWSDWCISKGAKFLRPATSSGVDCGDFFERLGFVPQGKTYLMGV